MNNPDQGKPTTEDWNTYWQGSASVAAFAGEGVTHPVVGAFWNAFFSRIKQDFDSASIIDVACGTGAVLESVVNVYGSNLPKLTCVDTSASAIEVLTGRFPTADGVVADVRSMPMEDGSFDVATSQFGVEYAGVEAVDEMIRVLRGGGRLAIMAHNRSGIIFDECSNNLAAIQALQKLNFIAGARRMFEEGHAVLRGETSGSRETYDAAVRDMIPVYRELEQLLASHGENVAGGTLLQLHQNVDRINQRLKHHDPDEVLQWLNRMESELEAYAGRMQSMCDSAWDGATYNQMLSRLRRTEFDIVRSEALYVPETSQTIAWILVADKPA